MPLEHAVEHQHRQEPLGRLVHDHQVLRPDHLGDRLALRRRAAVVAPRVADLQRCRCRRAARTARARSARRAQNRSCTVCPGETASRRPRRNPHQAQPKVERDVELPRATARARRGRTAPRRAAARPRRRTPPSRGCARGSRVPHVGIGYVEQRRAQRRVHHLVFEAEQVERGRRSAGSTAPSASYHFGPRAADRRPAPPARRAPRVRSAPLHVEAAQAPADRRQRAAHVRRRVVGEEAGPLHQVAVRVDHTARVGVRHGFLPRELRRTLPRLR